MSTSEKRARTGKRPKAGQALQFLGSGQRRRLSLLLRRKPALAAVAYVSDADGLLLGKGDILVCDASDATARAGSTRREALQALRGKGVEIWSCPRLHAKVVVAGGRVLVGSANWSARSATTLIEAGIEVVDARVVAAAEAFVRGLAHPPSVRVTQAFLERMPEPEVAPPDRGGREDDDGPRRHWLVSLHSLERLRGPVERMAGTIDRDKKRMVRTGVSARKLEHFLWPGTKGPGPRMRVEDTVTVIWREPGQPTVVYPPCEVLKVRKAEGVTGVLYLAPSRYESRSLPFRSFLALAKRSGLAARLGEMSNRELTEAQFEAMSDGWLGVPRRR